MNTRVFKDISKVQHRAWLGFTTRQVIFVFPAVALTILVLGLNLFYWQFGDWLSMVLFLALQFHSCYLGSIAPTIYHLKPTSSTVFIMN